MIAIPSGHLHYADRQIEVAPAPAWKAALGTLSRLCNPGARRP